MPSSKPPRILGGKSLRGSPHIAPFEGFLPVGGGPGTTSEPTSVFPRFAAEPVDESSIEAWGAIERDDAGPSALEGAMEDLSVPPDVRAARREAQRVRAEAAKVRAEAAVLLERARGEAARMMEQGRARSDEIEAAAYQAGFKEGDESGRRLGEQKAESVVRRLQAIVEETARQQAQAIHESEQELVKLAVLISLQIIHRELRQDPTVILDTVRAGIERLRRASRLTLRVSPQDFQFLEEHMDAVRGMSPAGTPVLVEPDESIARGGCRIVCNTGEIDATIETAVHKLIERVWGEHHPAEDEV